MAFQVLTAIYPAQTVALATGVVPLAAAVPPAVASPAQDAINPASPSTKAVQGSAVAATFQLGTGMKVEVKQESQLDSETEGSSGCNPSCSMGSCENGGATGKRPQVQFMICKLYNQKQNSARIYPSGFGFYLGCTNTLFSLLQSFLITSYMYLSNFF